MSKSTNAAVAVIRAYAYASGVPAHYVYNDPLKDGRRSVKVWGWQREDYQKALSVLRASGLSGRIVRNTNSYGWSRAPYRIWVD